MEYIYIGKIVNTHALKGELRIISNFEFKDKIFIKDNILYVGKNSEELKIETYRKHKNYDMVKFYNLDNINDVLKYKGIDVYYDKEKLNLSSNEYLDSDIIGLEAFYNNKLIGNIDEIEVNGGKKLLVIKSNLIPYDMNFIDSIDINNKKIYLKNVEGLINED